MSRQLAKAYLTKLKPNTMQLLIDQGVLSDPLRERLYTKVIPWIFATTEKLVADSELAEKSISDFFGENF